MRVVIIPEFAQLAHQVDGVPEERPIKVLTPDGSDQPFDERMRDRSVRNRLDFLDLEDAQIGEPAVESEQRVVVGTGVAWQTLAHAGAIEHPAYRDAVDAGGFNAEADDTAGEDIHDHHNPVAAQEDRFAAEQIEAPEAVFGMSDKGEPRRAAGTRFGLVVFREHAANDVFVDLEAEGARDLLSDLHTAKPGIAPFDLNDCSDEFWRRSFWTRSARMTRCIKDVKLELGQRPMEFQERRWPQGDRNLCNARWTHASRTESQKQSIPWRELGRSVAGTLQNQQLMLEN